MTHERGSRMKPSQYIAKGWCQGRSALDSEGKFVFAESTSAIQWCLIGALRVAYNESREQSYKVIKKLEVKLGYPGLSIWNDDPKRTKAEVIALLQSIGE